MSRIQQRQALVGGGGAFKLFDGNSTPTALALTVSVCVTVSVSISMTMTSTVEPLFYDHPQNHIGVVV